MDAINSPFARDIKFQLHPQTDARLHEQTGPAIARKGDGVYVTDTAGNRFLEGMAGLWCTSLGFSEKRLADAAYKQMLELPYIQNFAHRTSEPVIDLAEALLKNAPEPLSKAIFFASGSEATDSAIKFAWYYNAARGKPEKRKIISRMRAYHGTTIGSASLTGLTNMHVQWGLPLPGFLHVSCPHFYRDGLPGETEETFATRLAQELDDMITREGADTVAAFFAEPVMGTGGVVVPPATYFDKIQAVLKQHDVLLAVDEVICGFGRTGHYWGSDAFGIKPDMLTCAKGLSSAYLPISALLISDDVYQVIADETHRLNGFGHGYTYGGHPVSAAVALETLRIYQEDDILGHVRTLAPGFQRKIKAFENHPLVGEARGMGLMAAIELVCDKESKEPFAKSVKAALRLSDLVRAQGVILRSLGDSLCIAPPLIIEEQDIDVIIAAIAKALDLLEAELTAEGVFNG
ncbi:aminotransferase [Pararhizobium qamdonense]|uniref:aminotransferase n=1 Tax=Pararhizobium qamdonense TaxID=3031126 RepID=UPI0023E15322